jgi:Holliday junction resolvase RusA-like endonuclease
MGRAGLISAHLRRLGIEGAPNTANVSDPPFVAPAATVINLPTPPSVNNLFFNGKAGKGRIKTPEYQDWIREAGTLLAIQRPRGVPGKVSLLIEVGEPKTARRMDVANREKAAVDLLVSHRIIEGDDQRFVREITLRWAPIEGIRMTIQSLQ